MPYLVKIGTPWVRRKLLRLVPSKDIQRIVNIVDIMHEQAVEVYDAKKEALKKGEATVVQQVGRGKDILSILREYPKTCGPRGRVLTTNSEGEHGFGQGRSSAGRGSPWTAEVSSRNIQNCLRK